MKSKSFTTYRVTLYYYWLLLCCVALSTVKNIAVWLHVEFAWCVLCRLVAKLARTLVKLRLKLFLGLQGRAFRYRIIRYCSTSCVFTESRCSASTWCISRRILQFVECNLYSFHPVWSFVVLHWYKYQVTCSNQIYMYQSAVCTPSECNCLVVVGLKIDCCSLTGTKKVLYLLWSNLIIIVFTSSFVPTGVWFFFAYVILFNLFLFLAERLSFVFVG